MIMIRQALRRDRRGIAATEFALIAPVLITLLCGLIEFAWVQSARLALESAVMRGARAVAATDCPAQRETVLTQTVVKGMQHIPSSDGALPRVEGKAYASAFGDVGEPEPFIDNPAARNGRYDLGETFTDVNGNGQWDPDMGRSGSIGGAGQVVSYTATFRVRSLIPFIARTFGGGTDYSIRAATVIRNEPIFRSTGCP
jgi:hypothetical protein